MHGRHFLSGLLHVLLGRLFYYSFKQNTKEVIIKEKLLGIFTLETYIINPEYDDISTFTTSSGYFKTYHLILNGVDNWLPLKTINQLTDSLKKVGISKAPIIHSTNSLEPEYAFQLGKESAYLVSDCSDVYSWEYKNVSYNVANLKKGEPNLIVNIAPLAITNADVLKSYIELLKEKGCSKDPYILSHCPIIKLSLWERIKLFLISIFSKKQADKIRVRLPYLLLGKEYCFAELQEALIEDIVYFDYDIKDGDLHFGTGVDFYYHDLKQNTITGIREYFISKGAPLLANGESFTTRVSFNPSTWFKKWRQTVTLGSRGIYFTRRIGYINKTSFVPYFDGDFIRHYPKKHDTTIKSPKRAL